MFEGKRSTKNEVVTDHHGWPVAVNEGVVWWMVAEVESERSEDESALNDPQKEVFRLQFTNGRSLIATRDAGKRRWSLARRSEMDRGHDT